MVYRLLFPSNINKCPLKISSLLMEYQIQVFPGVTTLHVCAITVNKQKKI